MRAPYGRYAGYGTGLLFIALGAGGLLANARDTHPLGWAGWFGGVVLAHDLILAPLTLAATWALSRILAKLPAPSRGPLRGALIISCCVVLIALPLALGLGRRADNPSQLPLPYARNLIIVVALIMLAGVTAALWRTHRRGSGGARRALRAAVRAAPRLLRKVQTRSHTEG